MKTIIKDKLEFISKEEFKKAKRVLNPFIKKHPGIYVLYKGKDLYYVGMSKNLSTRLENRLREKKLSHWNYLTIYTLKKSGYTKDIESILIDASCPTENKVKSLKEGKMRQVFNDYNEKLFKEAKKPGHLRRKELGGNIKKKIKKAFKKPLNSRKRTDKKRPSLKNYFPKDRPLGVKYKGKVYKAVLLTSGKVEYNGTIYKSVNACALQIIDGKAINARTFWYVKDMENNWVKLDTLE